MNRWIAFLRGVNVGGHNRLPMGQLRDVLEVEGCENVGTYIQSGNLVFDSEHENYWDVSSQLTEWLREHFGITPRGHVYALQDMTRVIGLNPFRKEGLKDGKSVHFFLLSKPAENVDLDAFEDLKAYNEAFELTDETFYLLAPDGIGRSALVQKLDQLLGVAMTGRNMRTIYRTAALAGLEIEDV